MPALPAKELRKARAGLAQLLGLLARHGNGVADHKQRLLSELEKSRFTTAADILGLHRAACFLRAFPDNAGVHAAACSLCGVFADKVGRLPPAERAKLDDSGIAGSLTRNAYCLAAAEWLAARHPDAIDIDWSALEAPEELGGAIVPLLAPMEDETVELSTKGLLAWLRAAKGERGGRRKSSDLVWLIAQKPSDDEAAASAFTRAYDSAEVPLAWQLRDRAGAIAGAVVERRIVHRHAMRRPQPDSRSAIRSPLGSITHLGVRDAGRLVDVWRAALWARARTIFQIEQADRGNCYLADLGEGLELAIVGVPPGSRAPLEVNYGYLLLSNGMAMGYGGFTPLFAQVNTGINVFPDFRGSEAAFAWEQALRVMRTLTGCSRFIINPYQLGAGNREALQSGAFWFYYRLGFRPADSEVQALAETEFARLVENRHYRVPIARLRKLASVDVHLDLDQDAGERYFDERHLEVIARSITTTIAREGVVSRTEALGVLTRRLVDSLGIRISDWSAVEQRGLAAFAPILAQIGDLAGWPEAERRALADVCRSRWSPTELDFIAGMRRHDRLRRTLAAAASGAAKQQAPAKSRQA